MPAFCTHYLFGEEFLLELPTEKRHNKDFRSAFFYGVHGPDFLLFHRALPTMPGKSFRKMSTKLHSDNPVPLLELIQKAMLDNADNAYIQGYAAGFICHYALDRLAHPYVNFLQEAIIRKEKIRYSPSTVHNRIEANIDRFMLWDRFKIKDARRFSTNDTLSTDEAMLRCISNLMAEVINTLYKTKINAQSVYQAFSDFRKLEARLSNETYWRKPVAKIVELPIRPIKGPALSTLIRSGKLKKDWDYANTTKHKWTNLDAKGKTSDDSFVEIYENALSQAIYMYDEFLMGSDVGEVTEGISFNKGIPLL